MNVRALAGFVSELRDIQPELVDTGLASVLSSMFYETQPNTALHLHHLIVKQGWKKADAVECVAAAEAARGGGTEGDAFITHRGDSGAAYSADAAAASWEGTETHSTPVPKLFLGDAIQKVLQQVGFQWTMSTPGGIKISKAGQKVMSDLVAYAVDALLVAVDGLPASGSSGQFATVQANAYLVGNSAKEVLALRLMPRDEVLVHHVDFEWASKTHSHPVVGEADCTPSSQLPPPTLTWELRSEVVRVGLADALASFEAKTAAEQEAVFKAHCGDESDESDTFERFPVDDGVTTAHDVQTAVRLVLQGELCKHAVSEGTKATTKFNSNNGAGAGVGNGAGAGAGAGSGAGTGASAGAGVHRRRQQAQHRQTAVPVPCVSFQGGKVQCVNRAISTAAGLVVPVREIAHIMHARLSNPPSLGAAVYLAAVIEYLAAELLELSSNAARDCKSFWIQPRNLHHAVRNDEELVTMFQNVSILDGGILPHVLSLTALLPTAPSSKTEVVKTIRAGLERTYDDSVYFVSGTVDLGAWTSIGWNNGEYAEGVENISVGAAWVDCHEDDGGRRINIFTALSKEDQAALLKPSRDKAAAEEPASKRQRTEGGSGGAKHVINTRDNIQGITRDMILALAARAGCLMVSGLVFEETRGIIKVYLETLILEAVTLVQHKKRNVVLATDVLAAAAAPARLAPRLGGIRIELKVVCGTGRLASVHAARAGGSNSGGGAPSAFAKLAAEYSAKLARAQDADSDDGDDRSKHLNLCNEAGFNEAVTSAWNADLDTDDGYGISSAKDLDDVYGAGSAEDVYDAYPVDKHSAADRRHGSGVPYLTEDEIHADPMRVQKDALRYIRQMQQSSGPCLPFMPLSKLVREVAQDFKTDLDFEPEAFRVIQSMLETYLVGLFQDANLNCISGGGSSHRTFPFVGFDAADLEQQGTRSLAITPQDLQLACRMIRNERASTQ